MTPERIREIAEYYRTAKHEPEHPSYAVFVNSTLEQWRSLFKLGWIFRYSHVEPYATSKDMFKDLAKKRLKIFAGGQNLAAGHPLAEYAESSSYVPEKYKTIYTAISGQWLTVNEVFRAVHDVLGHGPTLCPFETFEGELEAIENHRKQYPREAWPALMGETLGQLCHYFAGYGFVEVQKAIVLPEEYWQ